MNINTVKSSVQMFIVHKTYIKFPKLQQMQLEMWANAQRDGRPAEHRWRLCSTPQSLADTH